MKLIVQSIYLMSTLSQVGTGTLLLLVGGGLFVLTYISKEENDPDKKTKSHLENHAHEVRKKNQMYRGYIGGAMLLLIGIGMLLDAMGFYNFK
jgi:hypothetical protein